MQVRVASPASVLLPAVLQVAQLIIVAAASSNAANFAEDDQALGAVCAGFVRAAMVGVKLMGVPRWGGSSRAYHASHGALEAVRMKIRQGWQKRIDANVARLRSLILRNPFDRPIRNRYPNVARPSCGKQCAFCKDHGGLRYV